MFQICKVVRLVYTVVAVIARLTYTTAGRWSLLLTLQCMIHKQDMVPGHCTLAHAMSSVCAGV